MSKYRDNLPLLGKRRFVTDGGLETTLVFEHGYELPEFAAFPLLDTPEEKKVLEDYYLSYIELAKKNKLGFVLESPTWRASRSWGDKIGYGADQLRESNQRSIEFLSQLRTIHDNSDTPIVISGCLGPRGDGYHIDYKMSIEDARTYHSEQINSFVETEADLVSAYTINYVEEAIGITLAAQDARLPVVISFTVETDGRLPSGQPLGDAIVEVDEKTGNGPVYYMINCAHPSHFKHVVQGSDPWLKRIRAVRANASCKSHAELDESETLDRGNPQKLGLECVELTGSLPNLTVFGGCCGTDVQHVEEMCRGLRQQN